MRLMVLTLATVMCAAITGCDAANQNLSCAKACSPRHMKEYRQSQGCGPSECVCEDGAERADGGSR